MYEHLDTLLEVEPTDTMVLLIRVDQITTTDLTPPEIWTLYSVGKVTPIGVN